MDIQDWAEYYFNRGINVIPDNEHFDWVDWRHKKQTIEELRDYDWASAKDIYAIVGKKGIRVLSILKVEDESIDLRNILVERALSLLELPYDYPWVVDYCDAICVFVESADDIQGMKSLKYNDIELLWQDTLCLPTGGSTHFFYGEKPQKRPTHVSNDLLLKCFETMRKDSMGETDWPYFCGQIRPDSLPVLDNFSCLSLTSKYDDGNKLLLGCWYMRDEGLHKIYIKASGEFVERTGREWRSINIREWSYGEQSTKKGQKKYFLHIKGMGNLDVLYLDEKIVYAKKMNGDKVVFVKEDAVDLFKNNDNIVSYFFQIDNRAKIQKGSTKRTSEKKSGCFVLIGAIALILMSLLV